MKEHIVFSSNTGKMVIREDVPGYEGKYVLEWLELHEGQYDGAGAALVFQGDVELGRLQQVALELVTRPKATVDDNPLNDAERAAAKAGRKLDAIKLVKYRLGLSLPQAKAAIEKWG